jgi:SGNH hydrolase-like domain, acetyltransferase AlgX
MTTQSLEHSDQLGRNSGLAGLILRGLTALCPVAVTIFLWWIWAGSPSQNGIFGRYSIKAFAILTVVSYFLGWAAYYALSRDSGLSKVANCALTTGSLLIALGLLELPAACGWIDYRKVISPPAGFRITNTKPWDNPANLLDKELIHIHPPLQRVVGEAPGDLVSWLGISTDRRYRIDLQYDKRGFRNDHEIERAPVVIIGDSFIEGILISKTDLLSSRLKNLLQAEVANLGQGGYGPQQELVTLRRYGLGLQPKIVLWFFFEGNDLLDVPRYEAFRRNWDLIKNGRDRWTQRSFTRNALLTLAGFTAPQLQNDPVEGLRRSGRFVSSQSGAAETLYFAYSGSPLSKEDLKSLETAETCLLDAQRLCAENGAKLVLFYIPTKFRVYREFCEFPEDGYGRIWQPNDLPSTLEAWCSARQMPYLDLTPALKESAASGELVYCPDDGHWNAKGNQTAATSVVGFLERNGYVRALK